MKISHKGYVYEAVELNEMAFASTDRLQPGDDRVQFSSLVDKHSRFEMDASEMSLDMSKFTDPVTNPGLAKYVKMKAIPANSTILGYGGVLGDILTYPDLYKYYPDTVNIRVAILIDPDRIIKDRTSGINSSVTFILAIGVDEEGILSTLEHEIQHYIQQTEGFPEGGTPHTMTDEDIDDIERTLYDMIEDRDDLIDWLRLTLSAIAEEAIPNVNQNEFEFQELVLSGFSFGYGEIKPKKRSYDRSLYASIMKEYKERISEEMDLPKIRNDILKMNIRINEYSRVHNIKYSNPKVNAYHRLAGEAEAESAAKRRTLTRAERETNPMDITNGYPLNRMIKRWRK